mmetsp:Transcript_116658/g.371121  ORF Transcript_116658/g.371121 Transcript_116658/m.371121 type:complete len:235 (+) Transcript_116658:1661-2365(+)
MSSTTDNNAACSENPPAASVLRKAFNSLRRSCLFFASSGDSPGAPAASSASTSPAAEPGAIKAFALCRVPERLRSSLPPGLPGAPPASCNKEKCSSANCLWSRCRPRHIMRTFRKPLASPVIGSITTSSISFLTTGLPCRTNHSRGTSAKPTCMAASRFQTSTWAVLAAKYSTSWRCASRAPPEGASGVPSMWYTRATRSLVMVLRNRHASPGPPESAAAAVRNGGKAKNRSCR